MEYTVNQFGKGLQMDTNPMVQDNGTLSDALNATFITMNGDEVILQNDMGNRRVDGAFLPPGYQPVGMKEYGGIIYVAAYNPITNRSQIGSFPSPERNIQPDEFDGKKFINLDQVYNFETRVPNCFYKQEEEGIPFLVNKSFLIPITDDTSLHAGDKFTIYSTQLYTPLIKYYHRISRRATVEISESEYSGHENDPMYFNKIIPWGTFVSNFDNITDEKVTSPKNEKYTLSVGVMNSQREFVDITKSLVRWNKEREIINTSEDSELLKFNKGYFIAPIKTSVDNTINDNKFIENRQISALNTYSFKLVGPLYLKATLNTIQNFSYTLIPDKDENYVTVKITADIDYNCPDGVFVQEEENNYGYYSLAQGTISNSFTGFDFYTKKGENNYEKIYHNITSDTFETTYDVNTNLYHTTITREYNLAIAEYSDNIIRYYICVSDCSDYYIKELSHKGEINILLIDSGTVQLNQWNYNWNNKILNYELVLYPEPAETYQDLYLNYQNITEQNSPVESVLLIQGGLGQGIIHQSYSIKNLEPDSMYICSLSYTSVSANSVVESIGNIQISEESEDHTSKRLWIMTTPFFDNETRKDFSTIEQVYVPYDFDAKLEVDEEAITYESYEKIPYVPSQTEPESQTFDFTNEIECHIPISTTYNDQTTLKDIPEEVAILDFQGQGIQFNIEQYIDTYKTLKTQTKGDISDWDENRKTEIDFEIESPSLMLIFSNLPTVIRNSIDSIVYSYASEEIVYINTQLRSMMTIPFQKGIESTLQINLKQGHTLGITRYNLNNLDVSNGGTEISFQFSGETNNNLYIRCNIDPNPNHHVPAVNDSNTTPFNYIIEGIYNDTLDATFKQPALFKASQQDVTVRNYLTSAKDALSKLADDQLEAPQVEIEYFHDSDKFFLERSADKTTKQFVRLDGNEIKLKPFEPNRENVKTHTKNITKITEDLADWDIGTTIGDNRILYAGVGMDMSAKSNLAEIPIGDYSPDIYKQNYTDVVIRVWLQYRDDANISRWALLYELPTGNSLLWADRFNNQNWTFKNVKEYLKKSSILDNALVYYGKFSNDIKQAKNLWAINKSNYYFISEIGIQVTLDYTYVIPDDPDSGIKINNLLENYRGQIPLFNLQFPTPEVRTKSTEFNLYSNQQVDTEFVSDMNKLLSSGSYVDYWSDNPVFNKHLDEINPDNTLFKIQRVGFPPDPYYIYIGTSSTPTDCGYIVKPEAWQETETGFTPPQPPFSWPYNAWFEIGSDITNFVWNDNYNKFIMLLVPFGHVYTYNDPLYIALPYENDHDLLTLFDYNGNLISLHPQGEIFEFQHRLYKLYVIYENELNGQGETYTLYINNDWVNFKPKIQYYNLGQEELSEETDIDIEEGTMIEEQWDKEYLYGSTKSEGFWPSLPITTGPREDLQYMYQLDQDSGETNTREWGYGEPMLDLTECPKIDI